MYRITYLRVRPCALHHRRRPSRLLRPTTTNMPLLDAMAWARRAAKYASQAGVLLGALPGSARSAAVIRARTASTSRRHAPEPTRGTGGTDTTTPTREEALEPTCMRRSASICDRL